MLEASSTTCTTYASSWYFIVLRWYANRARDFCCFVVGVQSDARSIAAPNLEIPSLRLGLWFLSTHVISVLAVHVDIALGVLQQTALDDAATAVVIVDNEFHRFGVKLCCQLLPMPVARGCKVELLIRAL